MGKAPKDYPTGRRAGRPSRMSPIVVKALVDAVSSGSYVTTACQYVGISSSSYSLWRRRGEAEVERVKALGHDAEAILQETSVDGDAKAIKVADHLNMKAPRPFKAEEWPYAVFLFQTDRASAAAEIRNLTIIQMAAGGDSGSWQAAAWILERTRPNRFGRRERINLEGSQEGEAIKVEGKLSVESLEASIAALRDEIGE